MLLNLVFTQGINALILILFLLQKNFHLEKSEKHSLISWLSGLILVNSCLIGLVPYGLSSLELLILASINGLASILYLFFQRAMSKEVCV